jgi:nucleoside-diphosphate-sugar epimerase
MELLVTTYVQEWNLPFLVFRCAGMYGEFGRPKQVVPSFISQAISDNDITIEGDGSQTRDFNYIKNTVFGIIQALKSDQTHGIWNISNGKETSIRELAETIIKLTDSKSKIVETPWRPGEKGVRLYLSIEKAKKELGYEPKYSLEQGLNRTIDWIKNP